MITADIAAAAVILLKFNVVVLQFMAVLDPQLQEHESLRQPTFPHVSCSCELPFALPLETWLHKIHTYVLSYHVSWLDGPSAPTQSPA